MAFGEKRKCLAILKKSRFRAHRLQTQRKDLSLPKQEQIFDAAYANIQAFVKLFYSNEEAVKALILTPVYLVALYKLGKHVQYGVISTGEMTGCFWIFFQSNNLSISITANSIFPTSGV